MRRKTWIYVVILVVVLLAAGIFFWWNYKSGQVKPQAETPTTVSQTFVDVPMGDPNNNYIGQYWAFNQIEAVFKKGWMVGYDWEDFRPTQNATNAMAAVAIARAYGKTANPDTPSFSDVAKDYWAYQEIEGLKAAGYISGTTFSPDEAINRGKLANILATAHNGGPVSAYNGGPTFTDCLNVTTCPDYNEIEYLATLVPPVITGYEDGTFRPNTTVERLTLALALVKDKNLNISNPPTTPSFYDIPIGSANFAQIEAVHTAGYMVGFPIKLFRPDQDADRAMVAVVIARATGNIYDNPIPTFTDVPKDYWAYKEIEGLNRAGIIKGFSSTVYCPDTNACEADRAIATRSTAAVVLARSKGLALEPNGAQVFADVTPATWGYAEINAIYKAGYTRGCGTDGSGRLLYCPDQQITRAVLAAFAYNGFILPTPSPEPSQPTPAPGATTSSATSRTGTTKTAKTGAEVPIAGAGILTLLFAARFWTGKKIT